MKKEQALTFKSNKPCNDCPYRKDAPLKHWHKEEFINLHRTEKDMFGSVFACHKKNGCVCIGWLIMQDKNNFPSIALRLKLTKQKITREYLDTLKCDVEMFNSTEDMINANYPEILNK